MHHLLDPWCQNIRARVCAHGWPSAPWRDDSAEVFQKKCEAIINLLAHFLPPAEVFFNKTYEEVNFLAHFLLQEPLYL